MMLCFQSKKYAFVGLFRISSVTIVRIGSILLLFLVLFSHVCMLWGDSIRSLSLFYLSLSSSSSSLLSSSSSLSLLVPVRMNKQKWYQNFHLISVANAFVISPIQIENTMKQWILQQEKKRIPYPLPPPTTTTTTTTTKTTTRVYWKKNSRSDNDMNYDKNSKIVCGNRHGIFRETNSYPTMLFASRERKAKARNDVSLSDSDTFSATSDTIQSTTERVKTRPGSSEGAMTNRKSNDNNNEYDDDEEKVLKLVSKGQLVALCGEMGMTATSLSACTKLELLRMLRAHARQQQELELERYQRRLDRIRQSSEDSKERYEVVGDDNESDSDDFSLDQDEFFFGYDPDKLAQSLQQHHRNPQGKALSVSPMVKASSSNNYNNNQRYSTTISNISKVETSLEGNNNFNQTTPTTTVTTTTTTATTATTATTSLPSRAITNAHVTAPPPPLQPNENGERVVTVYSTSDQNDMTGIAAAQPNSHIASTAFDTISSSTIGSNQKPWEQNRGGDSSTNNGASAEERKVLEHARAQITAIVQTLLSLSGLPAFQLLDDTHTMMDDDDLNQDDDDEEDHIIQSRWKKGRRYYPSIPNSRSNNMKDFNQASATLSGPIGFQPENVPVDLLTASVSQALLLRPASANIDSKDSASDCRDILDDVLRHYEIQAIGYDGWKGDDISAGGGHYIQVSKVRMFLMGYRTTLRRKQARTTILFLLNRLMSDGIPGLDEALSSIATARNPSTYYSSYVIYDGVSSGTRGDYEHPPQLNEALLEFLNDSIRQQQKKVDAIVLQRQQQQQQQQNIHQNIPTDVVYDDDDDDDQIDQLWNVTADDDGYSVASIDPNDPNVQRLVQQQQLPYGKSSLDASQTASSMPSTSVNIPSTGPEQLLLLLKLLRERIKVEAMYHPNNNNSNESYSSHDLRLLAYCLKSSTDAERTKLISQSIGHTIDRLDSFVELVQSSIDYGESTSYELQPARSMKLNVPLLQTILNLTYQIRQQRIGIDRNQKPIL